MNADVGWDDEPGVKKALEVPRYCPRCDLGAEPGESLCGGCGERLDAQGYCPICEHFWRRPAGSACPKHDVELEAAPPLPAPGGPVHWVTVGTFDDALKAEAPRIRLEAEGIPTSLEGSRMGGRSMYLVATGGVKLQVPEPLVADARVLLAQTWAAPARDDDLDDAWDELAPEPGSVRRSVMKGVILLMLFGPIVLALIGMFLWGTEEGG